MIYKVTSNIKHNGDELKKDSFIDSDGVQFAGLIAEGLIVEVEGANSIEEAREIEALAKKDAEEAANAPEVAQKNTWGPTPDDAIENQPADELKPTEPAATTEEGANTEEASAPALAKFKVLKEFEVTNEASKNFGKHEVGSVIEADPTGAQSLVEDGTLELIKEEPELSADSL